MKRKILFLCETVTSAHLLRTLALIRGLDPLVWEVHLAAAAIPRALLADIQAVCTLWPLHTSVASAVFLKCLAKGTLPYTKSVLREQIHEDLALLDKIRPEIVVGDFRLSLGISARLRQTLYINVTNITWNPTVNLDPQVPDLPIVRFLGERVSRWAMGMLGPLISRRLAGPFNWMATQQGLQPFGDLLDVYTAGDYVFYADVPGLVTTTRPLDPTHIVGGPLLTALDPAGIAIPPRDLAQPLIVISLGSSGNQQIVPRIVSSLRHLPVSIYVATMGATDPIAPSENVFVADVLPLDRLLPLAELLIFNGGCATGYLGLKHGVPLLAIPSNLDQFNFSAAIVGKGAARRIRPERVSRRRLQETVRAMLADDSLRRQARNLQRLIGAGSATDRFNQLVTEARPRP